MSFFIFLKNMDNIEATLYKVAENQSDLNNYNIDFDNDNFEVFFPGRIELTK